MCLIVNIFLILYTFNLFKTGDVALDFHLQKNYHEPRTFSNEEVTQLAQLSDVARFEEILSHVLVPRVVGTESHKKVREYIIKQLQGLGWTTETQESVQETPLFGQLTFTNVIARLNPSAERYLTLACHYDSKHMREGEFMAATDSAVPCAMMVDLAHALHHRLQPFKKSNLSLMMVFFDGEEAFVSWNVKDSLYGSRSLAETWQQRSYPYSNSETNELDRMDLLVLLDLIGTPQPSFYSYFRNTQKWYLRMVSAERLLTDLRLLKKSNNEVYFNKLHLSVNIDDDHSPFVEREVPCLHLIPTPFPDVWHKLSDNYNALDMTTIDNLNKILRVFTMEYLRGTISTKRPRGAVGPPSDL